MKNIQKKRANVSFKDLQIIYLKDGIDPIQKLHQEGKISRTNVAKALEALKEARATSIGSFERWVLNNFRLRRRGRAAPDSGSIRTYRVQRIQKGGSFLRLPVAALGVEKGRELLVRFDKNQITIQKKPSKDAKVAAKAESWSFEAPF